MRPTLCYYVTGKGDLQVWRFRLGKVERPHGAGSAEPLKRLVLI